MIPSIGKKFIYNIGSGRYLLKIVKSNGKCGNLLNDKKPCFAKTYKGHCAKLHAIAEDCCAPNKPTICFILIKSKL